MGHIWDRSNGHSWASLLFSGDSRVSPAERSEPRSEDYTLGLVSKRQAIAARPESKIALCGVSCNWMEFGPQCKRGSRNHMRDTPQATKRWQVEVNFSKTGDFQGMRNWCPQGYSTPDSGV